MFQICPQGTVIFHQADSQLCVVDTLRLVIIYSIPGIFCLLYETQSRQFGSVWTHGEERQGSIAFPLAPKATFGANKALQVAYLYEKFGATDYIWILQL